MASLSKRDISKLLEALNGELSRSGASGELFLVGGAVMCLVFDAREATKDVDGFFRPTKLVREAAARVGAAHGVGPHWLNDGVKGFLGERPAFDVFLELSNLKVSCGTAEYLFAMKCLAMRIGEEFQDEDDVRYLIRQLDLRSYEDAVAAIERYYPIERFPQKTLYALEEIFEERSG